jgi:hypothetical protein
MQVLGGKEGDFEGHSGGMYRVDNAVDASLV